MLSLPCPCGCFTPPMVISCKKGMFPDLPCKDAICTSVCFNDAVYVLFVLQSLSSLFHEIIRGKTHAALNSLPAKPSPSPTALYLSSPSA